MKSVLSWFSRIFFLLIIIGSVGGGYVYTITKNLPNPELFDQRQVNQSTKIYDRTGKVLLYEIHGEEKRTIIPIENIPQYTRDATIIVEDNQFYNHAALDWYGFFRAIIKNIINIRIVQGGSTITQQLAKNAFLSSEKTITRKIKELFLAIQLEKKYSKDEILELYLNQIPYGSNAYGIEAASQTFFNKKTEELTIAESAILASLPKAPTYYSPYGTHTEELYKRKNYIIEELYKKGLIDKKEKEEAFNEEIKYAQQTTLIKAPHFVVTIQEYLNKTYGEQYVENAGLKVISTLDWDMQQIAEKAVYEGSQRNNTLYEGKNAALVSQDAKTGQILALVGSYDYFDINNDGNFNVATQGLRQPGSAIKPIAYVAAFEKGYTPETIIFDVETDFDTTNKKPYIPHNFDTIFRGPVNLRNALAQSINIPAVKVLYLTGVKNVLNTAEKFGIKTLTEHNRYGLSLALGGGEVTLLDLTGAYSVFAQEGIRHTQHFILEITDSNNTVIEKYLDKKERVINAQYTRLINDILSDTEARKELYSASLYLTIYPNQEVAIKTGTTNDYRDAWTIGYTPSLVTGVWVGNNNNTSMKKKGSSILAALPIFHTYMSEVLKKYDSESFTRPDLIITEKDILNGKYTINGEIHTILHYIDKNNPQGLTPTNPELDPQYEKWENSIQEWLKINNNIISNNQNNTLINIKNPRNGDYISKRIDIEAVIKSTSDIIKIEVFLNNQIIDQKIGIFNQEVEYKQSFNINKIELQNVLKIKSLDIQGKENQEEIIIYLK